jgi:midasin
MEPVKRHENFLLFAAMNPASDIGKKNLPSSLRNRFTEIFVDELCEKNDLCLMINGYLKNLNPPASLINLIADFYIELKTEFVKKLLNGNGFLPTFSLRTLCRG